jgi:hypothetical protein
MKSCAYCGRENPDSATHCRECGTDEFVTTNPATSKVVPSEVVETAPDAPVDEPVELQRCGDSESLERITGILDSAGIVYRRSSLPEMFDIGKIAAPRDPQVIITVSRKDYAAARAAMEIEDLKMDLPANHYLLTSTDEELAEIVAQSSEWSAFDVAHARRLIRQRGIDLSKVDEKRAEHLRQLQRGRRPAPKWLIIFGWISSILGGVLGFGIAWSLVYMKEKTIDGEFFTYDEESRAIGKKMLPVAGAMLTVIIILLAAALISGVIK